MFKQTLMGCLVLAFTFLTACASDQHANVSHPQKIANAVNAKYPGNQNTLIYIDAPDGFIGSMLANNAVEDSVNNGKVAAIVSSLALKTSNVVVAGEDDALTAATIIRALALGKGKIAGAKAIVVGSADTQREIANAVSGSGVNLEFISNPN